MKHLFYYFFAISIVIGADTLNAEKPKISVFVEKTDTLYTSNKVSDFCKNNKNYDYALTVIDDTTTETQEWSGDICLYFYGMNTPESEIGQTYTQNFIDTYLINFDNVYVLFANDIKPETYQEIEGNITKILANDDDCITKLEDSSRLYYNGEYDDELDDYEIDDTEEELEEIEDSPEENIMTPDIGNDL